MKIGSVAWGWTPTPEDMPSGDSLLAIADDVQALGFTHIDYLSTYESLDAYFTEAECKRVARHCADIGLFVGGFVFQSPVWNDADSAATKTQLDYMQKCADAASAIGASTISCIIPGPFGAKPNRRPAPSDKVATNLPADYNFARDWERFVANIGKACDIAKKNGLTIAMECFPGTLCSTPHAMLELCKDVQRDNFGIQLDTAHLMNQHIDIETAIFMLGKDRILNVHIKDSDGITRGNLPAGTGLIDYTAVFTALRNIGYARNASVEVEFSANPKRYNRQALAHVRECLAGTY